MLLRLGTSYDEIRQARLLDKNNPDNLEELKRLADRIGVDSFIEKDGWDFKHLLTRDFLEGLKR